MTDDPVFLMLEHVHIIHRRMIEEFGGDEGVRDLGLLEAAVTMPQARFAGEWLHKGLPAMAAAYLFHICKNHAFVDGNKRTALATAEMFVRLNDCTLKASDDELEELTQAVANGTSSKEQTTVFFKKRVKPAKKPN